MNVAVKSKMKDKRLGEKTKLLPFVYNIQKHQRTGEVLSISYCQPELPNNSLSTCAKKYSCLLIFRVPFIQVNTNAIIKLMSLIFAFWEYLKSEF